MKRDLDLMRSILLKIEESDEAQVRIFLEMFPQPPDFVHEHICLLKAAGLVDGSVFLGGGALLRLTNQGHDFLELSRPQTRWDQTKSIVSKVGSTTIEVVVNVMTQLAAQAISESIRGR